MPKMATKAADNVFYKARIAAASWNDRLGSREGASEVTGIDRTRLANIELGTINPHPEEVLMLSDTYNAPELQNHFCSHLCPLGIGTISPIELEELERVTLQLISAMKSLPEVKDGIIDIAADGVIDAKEKPRMEQYLEVLDEITNKAQTLKLIYRKQFGKQEVYERLFDHRGRRCSGECKYRSRDKRGFGTKKIHSVHRKEAGDRVEREARLYIFSRANSPGRRAAGDSGLWSHESGRAHGHPIRGVFG